LDFAVTPIILVTQKQQSETWSVGSLPIGMAKGIQYEPFAHAARSLAHVTQQALVLITHFSVEIMLIAFLNHGCETPSSEFECQLTAHVA
jgi:hypothetical protein